MKMAEEFDRCKKCGGGWFERKEMFMVQKGSPTNKEPLFYKKEILFTCAQCETIQYKYIEE